jgi:hypothetical protein
MSIVVVRQHRGVNCFTPDSDYDYSNQTPETKALASVWKGEEPLRRNVLRSAASLLCTVELRRLEGLSIGVCWWAAGKRWTETHIPENRLDIVVVS